MSVSSANISRIPDALLIIMHLHLLSYPLKDASGYDEHLFDPARAGIRERAKAMEDISFFLVAKLERGRERAKSILPTYPCLQPSDTTSFRISLAKYLEALRHSGMHPTPSEHRGPGGAREQLRHTAPGVAWWWKDVVVRRSLLEECSGERFERLILALSTHALLKSISNPGSPSTLAETDASRRAEVLNELSQAYATSLGAAQAARRACERAAAALIRQQKDLSLLHERLADPSASLLTKYNGLSADRLLALCDEHRQSLLRKYWKREEGERALHFLISLAGLNDSLSGDLNILPGSANHSVLREEQASPPHPPLSAPSLPIAAAHHPTHLRSLTAPLFTLPASSRVRDIQRSPDHTSNTSDVHHPPAVSEQLDATARTQHAIAMALARAEAARRDLHSRVEELCATLTQRPSRSAAALGLWEPAAQSDNDNGVNFCTDPTAGLLHMHSLHSSPLALESRIAQIRTTMLPAYPPVPDPFPYISPSLALNSSVPPPVRTYTSRLPQRAQSAQTRGGAPIGGKGWATRSRLDPVTSKAPQNGARVAQTVTRLVPAAEITCVESQTHSARDVITTDVDEIVQSVTENSPPVVGGFPTTDCRGGTAGTLLSTLVKRSAPQWWLDMEQQECYNHIAPTRNRKEGSHERRYVSGAPEQPDQHRLVTEMACGASPPVLGRADEMDELNEGDSSLTLRDVLLKAGKEDITRLELLGDEEMEDMVDWD